MKYFKLFENFQKIEVGDIVGQEDNLDENGVPETWKILEISTDYLDLCERYGDTYWTNEKRNSMGSRLEWLDVYYVNEEWAAMLNLSENQTYVEPLYADASHRDIKPYHIIRKAFLPKTDEISNLTGVLESSNNT